MTTMTTATPAPAETPEALTEGERKVLEVVRYLHSRDALCRLMLTGRYQPMCDLLTGRARLIPVTDDGNIFAYAPTLRVGPVVLDGLPPDHARVAPGDRPGIELDWGHAKVCVTRGRDIALVNAYLTLCHMETVDPWEEEEEDEEVGGEGNGSGDEDGAGAGVEDGAVGAE